MLPNDRQQPGADNPAAPTPGEDRADGETYFTKEQVSELVAKAVQDAIGARFGKEKSKQERAIAQARAEAAAEAEQSFREQHGLSDSELERLKALREKSPDESAKLRLELSSRDKALEAMTKEVEAMRAKERNRTIDDALDRAIGVHPVRKEAMPHVRTLLRSKVAVDDAGELQILGDDGSPLHGVTVDKFVGDQMTGEFKYALEARTAGGGGSRPGTPAKGEPMRRDLTTSAGIAALTMDSIRPKS